MAIKNQTINTSFKLKGEFSIYMGGKIVALIISFALLPVLARYMTKSDFGIVGLLWLIIPLTRRAVDFGSDVSVTLKFFKLSKPELSNWVYHALSIFITNLIIGLLLIKLNVFSRFEIDTIDLVLIIFIGFIQSFNSFQAALSKMQRKAVTFVLLTNLPQILGSLATLLIVIFISASYKSYLFGVLLGQSITGIWSLRILLKYFKFSYYSPKMKIYFDILRVGLPVIPGTISVIILNAGDRWVIEKKLGLEMVAIYTMGYRMAEYFLITFLQPLQNTLIPRIMNLASKDIDEAMRYSEKTIYQITLFVVALMAVVLWPQKFIIGLIGGEEYLSSYLVYLIVLLGIFISTISNFLTILFNHFEKTIQNMLINTLLAAVNISLNFSLIPFLGVYGACIATVITFLIQQPIVIYVLNRQLPNTLRINKILFLELLGFILISTFCVIEIWNIPSISLEYIVKIIFSLVFITLIFLLFPDFKNKLITEVWQKFRS